MIVTFAQGYWNCLQLFFSKSSCFRVIHTNRQAKRRCVCVCVCVCVRRWRGGGVGHVWNDWGPSMHLYYVWMSIIHKNQCWVHWTEYTCHGIHAHEFKTHIIWFAHDLLNLKHSFPVLFLFHLILWCAQHQQPNQNCLQGKMKNNLRALFHASFLVSVERYIVNILPSEKDAPLKYPHILNMPGSR